MRAKWLKFGILASIKVRASGQCIAPKTRTTLILDRCMQFDQPMNERTQEIINRFEKSWNETLERYQMLIDNGGFDKLIPIRNLIIEMKENGEWKHYRIGTSMFTLIFSRSVY